MLGDECYEWHYGDAIAVAVAVIAATGSNARSKADVHVWTCEICYENNFIILHTLSYVSCVFQWIFYKQQRMQKF